MGGSVNLQIESWNAIAPGLDNCQAWTQWIRDPVPIDASLGKLDLSAVPAMLRRRFNTLGKCVMAAALPLVEEIDAIPGIFASRHGDTELSLAMLSDIGREEPMSPTNFSLAVHNAISGLFTIARKDTSEVTAIAAMEDLVLQTLFEAVGQLQHRERVLCVIYDIPLPEFYRQHANDAGEAFPFAVAMILARSGAAGLALEFTSEANGANAGAEESEFLRLMQLLCGISDEIRLSRSEASWRIGRINK